MRVKLSADFVNELPVWPQKPQESESLFWAGSTTKAAVKKS